MSQRSLRLLRSPSLQAGATMAEVLVVGAVVAVLLAAGAPAVQDFRRSAELREGAANLVSHLYSGRTEAITRGIRVTLCKSSDGQSCAPGGGWDAGWIMFRDRNGNGLRDASEAILRHGQPAAPGVRILGNTPVADYVSFRETGETRLAGGGFQAGTLTVCHASDPREARLVVINSVGRPRVEKAPASACV